MGRGKKRRTRNGVSSPRLRSFTPRYVTLPTTHLNDLLLSHTQRRALLSSPAVSSRSNPISPVGRLASTSHKKRKNQPRYFSSTALAVGYSEPVGSVREARTPTALSICASRHERREVLFAVNKTGKSGQKRARWTERSYKRCK